jgi:hypothetical protein
VTTNTRRDALPPPPFGAFQFFFQKFNIRDTYFRSYPGVIQGTLGVIQGTFGLIQGTCGVIQGTFGLIQGTCGLIKGTCGLLQGTYGVVQGSTRLRPEDSQLSKPVGTVKHQQFRSTTSALYDKSRNQ